MPSTAFDEHPYPKPSTFMPSRPEWVLGSPTNSTLAQRRRSLNTSSPPPRPHSASKHRSHNSDSKALPHRSRTLDNKGSRHRSPSYERSRSRQPRTRHRSISSSRTGYGYAERNNLALTPLYAPGHANKENWTMSRRPVPHYPNQAYYMAPHPSSRRRRNTPSPSPSSPSSSDADSSDNENNWRAKGKSEDWVAAQKKKRNQKLLTTSLALVSTVACCNNLYQNRKAYAARREERARAGGMAATKSGKGGKARKVALEEEAKQLRQKHMVRDVVAVAVAGVCVNNARKGWQRVHALEK